MRLGVVLRKVVGLLSSGAVAGVGMLLLASGRGFSLGPDTLAPLLGVMTWQVMGVTVCKLGADQVVMAACFGARRAIELRPVFLTRVLPLAVVFLLVSLPRYEPGIALIVFFSILLDAVSVIYQAKLAAELRALELFISNFLNYPVFLLLLYLSGLTGETGLTLALSLFLVSSLARFVYLQVLMSGTSEEVLSVQGDLHVGAYQGVNFWIFRGAQVLVGFGSLAYPPAFIADLFFFWKGIELIDKVNTTLSPLVFRMVDGLARPRRLAMLGGIALAYCLIFLVFCLGAGLLLGKVAPLWMMAGLALNVALVLPLNFLIFQMIRREQTRALLGSGVWVCALSALVFAAAVAAGVPGLAIVFLTPLQLGLMVAGLSMSMPRSVAA